MAKIFLFRGKSLEELKKLSIEDFARLLASRERRRLKRGLTEQHRKLLENIRKNPEKFHKTHVRDMVVLPEMVGVKLGIHTGGGKKGDTSSKWASVIIAPEMVGHRMGELAATCKRVKHSSPGVGATRGSKHIPLK
jgi:small subunit ribosomal protein S19